MYGISRQLRVGGNKKNARNKLLLLVLLLVVLLLVLVLVLLVLVLLVLVLVLVLLLVLLLVVLVSQTRLPDLAAAPQGAEESRRSQAS